MRFYQSLCRDLRRSIFHVLALVRAEPATREALITQCAFVALPASLFALLVFVLCCAGGVCVLLRVVNEPSWPCNVIALVDDVLLECADELTQQELRAAALAAFGYPQPQPQPL